VLRWGALGGATVALGPLSACAGPTGAPGPGTLTLGLNRSLVSPDNTLNQFEAAVTVQRAVRQALTRIGPDLEPQLVLDDRFERTEPTAWTVRLRDGVGYSDGSPVTVEDVATALTGTAEEARGVLPLTRSVEAGSAQQIVERPAEPYTRKLLAAVPRVGTWDEDSDGRTEPVAEEAAA
jgi:peptide/nickel transport system substrate-binding protein